MKTTILGVFIGMIFSAQIFPQWFWQNPSPHGNSNNRLDFSSSNSFTVVGNAGTIIRTNNNGVSWDRQFSPTNNNLNDIDYFQTGTAIIVGNKGTILRTSDSGNNWDLVSSGTTTNLTGVKFYNSTNGIITGWNGLILRTTNSGLSWDSIATPISSRLYSVSFANASSGMAVGDVGVVLKTNDGGLNWIQQTTGTVQSLYDVSYLSSSVAYASGWGGTVIKTTNGGSSWSSIGFFSYIQWGVSFADANNGVVSGDQNNLNFTTDGGATWSNAGAFTGPFLQTNFHCVRFYDSNVGVAVGEYGAIFRTTDGGMNWQIITKGVLGWSNFPNHVDPSDYYSVQCINSNKAVVTSKNRIYITNNSGVSWNDVSIIDGYPRFDDVSFGSSSVGVMVGLNQSNQGVIFRTANGGNDWSMTYGSGSDKLNAVHLLPSGHGIAVGDFGFILRTSDGGLNWTNHSIPQAQNLYDVCLIDSLTGYAVGRYGAIYKTTNGGFTWTQMLNSFYYNLYGVAFSDANNGIAVGDSLQLGNNHGVILKTSDGGNTWNKQVLGYPLVFNDVTFTSASNWYVIGNLPGNGIARIFKSTDSGNNWTEQIPDIPITRRVSKISAFDDSNLLIAGYGGALIRGVNGGSPNQAINNTLINLNLPINNGQTAISTMTFTPPGDQPVNTILSENIVSVEVTIDEVLHTRTGDLTFTLEHGGVTTTIISEAGGNGQDFISTVLNDNASVPITNGAAPFTGFYIPSNPLNTFNGMNAYGDWTLTVTDGYAGNDGILNSWSLRITLDSPNDIEEEDNLTLKDFVLYQNYPNPFNPTTSIKYQVSGILQVSLKIYDLLGREVATLVNEEKERGAYTVNFNASGLASGIYFYRLHAGSFVEAKKMILMR